MYLDVSNIILASVSIFFDFSDPSFSDDEATAAIQDIMETLQSVRTQSQTSERRSCMTQLIRMTREGKTNVIQENFR